MIQATARAVLAEFGYDMAIERHRSAHYKSGDYVCARRDEETHLLIPYSHMNKWGEVRFRALVAERLGQPEGERAA